MDILSTTRATTSPGSTGFASLLAVAFIVLKLTGHIDWSWWWVLAPIWISALLVLCILGGVAGYLYYQDRRGTL